MNGLQGFGIRGGIRGQLQNGLYELYWSDVNRNTLLLVSGMMTTPGMMLTSGIVQLLNYLKTSSKVFTTMVDRGEVQLEAALAYTNSPALGKHETLKTKSMVELTDVSGERITVRQ